MKLMRKYDVLAILLSPTVMALVTVLAVLKGNSNINDWLVALFSIVIGPVLPVILLAAMKRTDLNVTDQARRTPLLMLAIFSYFLGFTFFHSKHFWIMEFVTLSYGIVTLGVAIINAFYMKGSVHRAGIVGPGTILLLLGLKEGIYMLLLTPLVASIRLRVKAHDELEILAGGIIALVLTLFAYYICT